MDEIGAHAQGYNSNSLGICMVGCDKFTRAQWGALRDHLCGLAKSLEQQLPNPPRRFNNPTPAEALAIFTRIGVRVVGHRELNPDKVCPNFNVAQWLENGMQPLAGQIYLDPTEGAIA